MSSPTPGTPGTPGTQASAPRPRRADARRNYERLLVAAEAAFTQDGPDASLEDIARRAGVGIGTLYRPFPTRTALLEAAYLEQIRAITACAERLAAEAEPGPALVAWLREFAGHNVRYRGLKGVLGPMMHEEGSALSQCKDAVRAAARMVLVPAQQAGVVRPDLTVPELLRLVHALVLTAELTEQGVDEVDRLLSLLLGGLLQKG
jgi:AcrR family transcriptional regulator